MKSNITQAQALEALVYIVAVVVIVTAILKGVVL